MALNIDAEDFIKAHYFGTHSLKANFYPKVKQPKEKQTRCPEHTDGGCITLLAMTDTKKSLEVRNVDGEWVQKENDFGD